MSLNLSFFCNNILKVHAKFRLPDSYLFCWHMIISCLTLKFLYLQNLAQWLRYPCFVDNCQNNTWIETVKSDPSNMVIILQFGFAVCLFVRKLLCCLWTDHHQTRQERQGRAQRVPKGIGFHGNLPVVMVTKKKVIFMVRSGLLLDLTLPMTSWLTPWVMSHDVTSPMTSWMTSPWQWCHGNTTTRCLSATVLFRAPWWWLKMLHFCHVGQMRVRKGTPLAVR